MERRHPSITSSLSSTDSSIRRCSGRLSPNSNSSDSVYSSPTQGSVLIRNTSQDWAFLTDDEHAIQRKPTVLLVNPLHSSRRHPSGPLFPQQPASLVPPVPLSDRVVVHHDSDGTTHSPARHTDRDLLSPINVKSRPETSSLSMYDPNKSSESLISLPTPNFTATRNRSFRSMLPRRLNFLSFGGAHRLPSSAFTMVTPVHSPQNVGSESDYSTSSVDSTMSDVSRHSNSIDGGRSSLIPSINTTDKFTDKWPRPQSLRALSTDHTHSSETKDQNQTETVLLEKGQGLQAEKSEKWTTQKWCLVASVVTVFAYATACLACALMTWLRILPRADAMYTADSDVLILATLTGSLLIFAALVGMAGICLNSRPLLAIYAILLWPGLVSIVAVGYITYKRSTYALDNKLDSAWSQWYTSEGRLLIQDALHCCGFYDALHEAIPSKRCYPRTTLPGCKGKLYRFEKEILSTIWSASFSLVPLHILNIMVALLCANHITKTFGEGVMPKKYRLTTIDLKADAEKISSCQDGLKVARSQACTGLTFGEDKDNADEDNGSSIRCLDWNLLELS